MCVLQAVFLFVMDRVELEKNSNTSSCCALAKKKTNKQCPGWSSRYKLYSGATIRKPKPTVRVWSENQTTVKIENEEHQEKRENNKRNKEGSGQLLPHVCVCVLLVFSRLFRCFPQGVLILCRDERTCTYFKAQCTYVKSTTS